jgi:chromosome segregation ATPase
MNIGDWLAANWVPALIILAIGFILGWLILAMSPRRKLVESESNAQDLDWKLREANKSLAASQKREQELQAGLDATKAALVQANGQTTQANSLIGQLQDELAGAQQQAAEAQQQAEALQANLDQVNSQGANVQNDLAASQQQVRELQASLDEGNGQGAALQQSLAARDAELTELKLQHSALRTTAQQSYDGLTAQVEGLRTQVQGLTEENTNLKINLEGTSADLAKARADNESMTQALANKDTALTEAYARAVRLERDASEGQSQLLTLQADLAAAKRNLASVSAANQDMNKRLENARGEVANELAVLTSTMIRVKDEQLAQANDTIAALQAQLTQSSVRPHSS